MSPDPFLGVSPRSIQVTHLDDVVKVEVDEVDRAAAQGLLNKHQSLFHLNGKREVFCSSVEFG
jgi:hypothetical protein